MATQILINGVWAATIGGIGALKWSTVADGGSEEASWRMALPDTFTHPALRTGKLVELKAGSANVWSGVLNEPDISADGWQFNAIGLAEEATGYLCLTSGGDTTSTPDTAIDQAILRGLPWTRPVSLQSTPFALTDATDNLNYLSDLLDAWATSQSKRWRVDVNGVVSAAADPTTPTWHMTPGSARIGLADDDYASNLYGRYRSAATTYATVTAADTSAAGKRRREYPVNLTSRGVTTSGNATNILTGMLAKGKARYAWTHPANPSRMQLTTPGGQPAYLPFVRAGDMVRTHGVINEQGTVLPYVDWIIGKTEYEDGADTIQLAPTELAARTLGDVLSLAVS